MEKEAHYEQLLRKWVAFKKRFPREAKLSNFVYPSEKTRTLIFHALCLWSFVKDLDGVPEDLKKRFLMNFVDDENRYRALVAKIEMLPERVWRKLLWRSNIDFLSLESFLRRITNAQIADIDTNWNDLYGPEPKKVPSVFRLSVRDRLLLFLYTLGVQMGFVRKPFFERSITATNGTRYLSKGAWAYNLALLDFGFAKYPGGIETDEEIADRSAMRFLSTKNHVNDFIVNKDDGLYWFFYVFVRSVIFFWNDSKKVTLSPWICPGFWKTLLFSAWFFIGPISLVAFLWFEQMNWVQISLVIAAASLTCAWVFVILVMFIVYGVGKSIEGVMEVLYHFSEHIKTPRFFKGFGHACAVVAGGTVFFAAISWAGTGVARLARFLVNQLELIGMHSLGALFFAGIGIVLFLAMVICVVYRFLYRIDVIDGEKEEKFAQQRWAGKSILAFIIFVVAFLCVRFHEPLGEFFASVGAMIAELAILLGNYWLENGIVIAAIVGLSGATWYLLKLVMISIGNDDYFISQKRKTIGFLLVGAFSIIALLVSLQDSAYWYSVIAGSMFFVVFSLLTLLLWKDVNDEEKVTLRKEFVTTAFIYGNEKLSYIENRWVRMLMRKIMTLRINEGVEVNKYLTAENHKSTTDFLKSFIERRIFIGSRFDFLTRALKVVNEKILDALYDELGREPLSFGSESDESYFYSLLLSGHTADSARKKYKTYLAIRSQREMRKKAVAKRRSHRQEKTAKALGWLLSVTFKPVARMVVKVARFVWKFLCKVGNAVADLYRFGRLMYKDACPYIKPTEKL